MTSRDTSTQRGLAPTLILACCLGGPMLLIIGLLFLIMVVDEDQRALDCAPTGPGLDGGAGTVVPVDSVPAGPVAGYRRAQLRHAAIIMNTAASLGMSSRDQRLGVMTAMGESSLRNLPDGHLDSVGLFQQRGNGAWGTRADRMNPETASTNFFRALQQVVDRDSLEPTIAAHRVQRNADPYHYRPYWGPAGEVVAALTRSEAAVVPVAETGSSSDPYRLGPVTPQLASLVAALAPRFGIDSVGGYRPSARDPLGHPAGLAADFMVPLTPAGKARGAALAVYAQTHAAELGVDYIIWYQQIWSADRAHEGWRGMADRGSATQNHLDHVHINVHPDGETTGDGAGILDPIGLANPDCPPGGSSATTWVAPIDAPVTSGYGWRTHPIRGERSFHNGADYGAACGTPFVAAGAGTVTAAGPSSGYGHAITIDHGGGIETTYGHMFASGVKVRVGDQVAAGQVIGLVGSDGWSTGCHLHFVVTINGETTDPVKFLADPPVPPAGTGVRLVTFNALGHSHTRPGGNKCCGWPQAPARTAGLVRLLDKHQPGVMGLQEFTPVQLTAFRRLTGETYRSYGNLDNHIVWRRDQYRPVATRLLTIPYFGGQPRKMPIVTLQDRASGLTFTVINVHNPADVHGPAQRYRNTAVARELAEVVRETRAGRPTVLLGDFNERRPIYCKATRIGMTAANGGTPGPGRSCRLPADPRVDWIFGAGLPLTGYTVDASGLGTISDHRMILATLTVQP